MNDFIKVSPLKLMEMSSCKGLGKGKMGALVARAGVGKTACLIHIAFDKLFRKEKLVHVSLDDSPEKVASYYDVIFSDLVKALEIKSEAESRMILDRNRMILAYLNKSFKIERLRDNLNNLIKNIEFKPDSLIVDGLDFENTDRSVFEGFRDIATEFNVEIWFSALSHRHIDEKNVNGIPYPCSRMDDLLSVIIHLNPTQSGIFLTLLKDNDKIPETDNSIRLDPNTFLATV